MNKLIIIIISAILLGGITSCSEKNDPKLVFVFRFDTSQVRLNNFGQPSVLPANHRAQHPQFRKMSAHYIELTQGIVPLGTGAVLYWAPETTAGGDIAIDFNQSVSVGANIPFFEIALKEVPPGTYGWLRVSLAYQNYDIKYRISPPAAPFVYDGVGTVASFVGYRTYIQNYTIHTQSVTVGGNRLQGYWGFETTVPSVGSYVFSGQAPAGATTVPNPLVGQSDIPPGSCVVTGQFITPFVITGNETQDVRVVVSLSVNNSFEWIESGGNGLYEPMNGDTVIDMGIRGLIPYIE